MDTLGIEPRASRMLSGCDTTTPRALLTDRLSGTLSISDAPGSRGCHRMAGTRYLHAPQDAIFGIGLSIYTLGVSQGRQIIFLMSQYVASSADVIYWLELHV